MTAYEAIQTNGKLCRKLARKTKMLKKTQQALADTLKQLREAQKEVRKVEKELAKCAKEHAEPSPRRHKGASIGHLRSHGCHRRLIDLDQLALCLHRCRRRFGQIRHRSHGSLCLPDDHLPTTPPDQKETTSG